jgi:hypothetical protein
LIVLVRAILRRYRALNEPRDTTKNDDGATHHYGDDVGRHRSHVSFQPAEPAGAFAGSRTFDEWWPPTHNCRSAFAHDGVFELRVN